MTTPLLRVKNLKTHFHIRQKGFLFWQKTETLKAVDGISFDLQAGQTLGIVGESGCGKSTLAKTLVGLIPATSGSVLFNNQELIGQDARAMKTSRQDIQMVFQDPLASLNPRMTVKDILAEPLKTHHPNLSEAQIDQEVQAMMQKVGLLPSLMNRYPHEFSGGQCQRIGIARALILKPKLVICDEPVSALDVSIQAQVINLLKQLQQELGLALIFIAHDLAVVKHISDQVLVMYLGQAAELGDKEAVYGSPAHPYTQALLAAVPTLDPKQAKAQRIHLLTGDLPSPIHPPSGCVFHTRCPKADNACNQTKPILTGERHHQVACLHSTTK